MRGGIGATVLVLFVICPPSLWMDGSGGSSQSLQLTFANAYATERAVLPEELIRPKMTLAELMRGGSQAWCPLLNISATRYPRNPNALSIANCYNEKYVAKNSTFQMVLEQELASIKIAGVFWSGKQRALVPITVVTQASYDRLDQLRAQCTSWKGHISAVVYLGLYQPDINEGQLDRTNTKQLFHAAMTVAEFFLDVDRDESMCSLDLIFAYEIYTDELAASCLYPINRLRNLARLGARTPLIASVDVDMLFSSRFYQDLSEDFKFRNQLLDEAKRKTAFILPGFDAYGDNISQAVDRASLISVSHKGILIQHVMKKTAGPFAEHKYAQGHNSTKFFKFYAADTAYNVTYEKGYEPWVVVSRSIAPWFDVRFRGYGQNKISNVNHMNSTGFTFTVLHYAWLTHRAHEKTVASDGPYEPFNTTRHHNSVMFNATQLAIDLGQYRPSMDEATANCRATLPWLKESERELLLLETGKAEGV